MTAEPWTPNEIDYVERVNAMREERPDFAACRALATIRALQAEIAELKTPSGYCDGEGETIWKPDSHGFDPATTVSDLEDMLYQELVDDGDTFTFTPYRNLPPETYIVRWVPDPDDPYIQRVKLERVEQSQHPIGDLREEAK
jgi:hypothetical protein